MSKFSRTVKVGNILRSSGTYPTPSLAMVWGGIPAIFRPFEDHFARPRVDQPDDRFQSRAFPHAVSSQEADDFPLVHVQGDPLEDVTLLIIRIQLFYLQ